MRFMRLCVMVEGQEGVTWDDWIALARTSEEYGYEALFRSDHYGPVMGQQERGSLDAWTTIAGLAAVTSALRLGTLVSPATFRHPSVLAKSAVTADHISGGRIEVGMGAGWNEAEHRRYGFPFPPTRERMDIFAEQLEIVHRQWKSEPFSFEGEHYRLVDSDPLPKPVQSPHPPLIVGGRGGPRSVALAARWADEYNTVYATAEQCRERRERIAEACAELGREPLTFSLMTSFAINGDPDNHPPSWLVGSVGEIAEQLRMRERAGVDRVMLQHLRHDDLETVELFGRELIPAVS